MPKSSTASAREFRIADEPSYDTKNAGRWIASHVFRYPFLPVLLVFTSLVNNTAYSNIQVFIGRSFDEILARGGAGLTALVLVIAASALVQGIMGLARNFVVEVLAQRIERDSREEYYASLLGKSQTFHGRQRVGDLMARATYDVHMLNLMFSPGVMLIVDSALAYIVPLAMIFSIRPELIAVPILFTVFLVLTVLDYNRRLAPVSIKQQDQYGAMSAGIEEAVAGIVTVKANARESYELRKFLSDARVFRDYFVEMGVIQAKYWPMLVFAACWGLALIHGLYLYQAGVLSLGQVVGFMGLFSTFRFVTFISLFSFNMVQQGMASAGRILSVIKTETELDENVGGVTRRIEGAVEFRGVGFSYNGNRVLRDIAFRAEPGNTVAIVGRTGSGKSTLTRLVNRIFDPETGSVLIDGIDARKWNLESLRSQISAIEQDVFLFSKTIRENISFGCPDASMEDIEAAAGQAQAHEFITSFKDGYETLVGERGVTLSGGQKQRIAIARAFLTDPRILILDDSTSAIDSRTEDEIQKAMRMISRSRTTLIITHRLSQIRWADHIIVLHRGEIVDQGRHDDLLSRSEDYRRIFAGL